MAHKFVSGGVQHNVLQKRQEDEEAGRTPTDGVGQYVTHSSKERDVNYEQKLADAGKKLNEKSTSDIIKRALEHQKQKQEQYAFRQEQQIRYEKQRAEEEAKYGRAAHDIGRERYRDDPKFRDPRYRPESYDEYGPNSKKAWHARDQFKASDGFVTARTGYRYIPRNPNDPIGSTEIKGWLHCWCQTMEFDKPEYEIEVQGKPPRQKFTVTLSVKTKRGEEFDIKPTIHERSKKLACTNAAWAFVDELVKRELIPADELPRRDQSDMLSSNSGITDCTAIDTSPEEHQAGGYWSLTNSIIRLNKFCQFIKVPLDIKMHAYGPDHDRKTDAHCTIRFQVQGEKECREYNCSVTTRNKKQATAAVSLSMMRALYKDGFVEKHGQQMKWPPRVWFNKSSSVSGAELEKMEKDPNGGWLPSNSTAGLAAILKKWGLPHELDAIPMGRMCKNEQLFFKSELRLTLVMTTQAHLTTKHELYAWGREKSKKDAIAACSAMMMGLLFKFGIVQQSHYSINRGGPQSHLWQIQGAPPGAEYDTDDVYIMRKLNELRPDPKELNYPSTVVSHIEAALKCCSDWLHEEETKMQLYHIRKGKRTLLGMQRVGPIAMDILLTGERRAHVILTCGRRPTKKILDQVAGKIVFMLQYTEKAFMQPHQKKKELKQWHEEKDEEEANQKAIEDQQKRVDEELQKAKNSSIEDVEKIEKNNQEKVETPKVEDENPGETTENDTNAPVSDDGWNKVADGWAKPEEQSESSWVPPVQSRPDPEYYQVKQETHNSGFLITYGIIPPTKMIVRVTVTSTLLRNDINQHKNEEQENISQVVKIEAEDPEVQVVAEEKPVEESNKMNESVEVKDDEETNTNTEVSENQAQDDGQNEQSHQPDTQDNSWGPMVAEPNQSNQWKPQAQMQGSSMPGNGPPGVPPSHMNGQNQMGPGPSWGEWNQKSFPEERVPTEEEAKAFKFGPYSRNMLLEECQLMEEEEGPLATQPGLGALAELRRIKWYQHVGLAMPFLSDILRLFRGLAIRESSWRSFRILCPWTISLICHLLIKHNIEENNNSTIKLSPARVLTISLEAIGKGFRFPVPATKKEEVKTEVKEEDVEEKQIKAEAVSSRSSRTSRRYTHKLSDPCEAQEDYDALSFISSQRKADIRACAKYAMDLIERKQLYLLLGLEKDEVLEKFNYRSGEGANVERGLTRAERKIAQANGGVYPHGPVYVQDTYRPDLIHKQRREENERQRSERRDYHSSSSRSSHSHHRSSHSNHSSSHYSRDDRAKRARY